MSEANVRSASRGLLSWIAGVQGVFYVVTGIWPILHLRSFLAVTGPKTDLWLVQTVGAILAVIGLGVLLAARSGRITREIAVVAIGTATVLALVDVIFAIRRTISPIYLLDAAAEGALIAGWCVGWRVRPDVATQANVR